MADLHIDDFCKDTAKTLITLYNRFPQKSILYVEDITGPDTPDEFGLHSPRFQAGFNTLLWLAETDYLYYKQTIRQEALEEATLSHRAFVFLCSPTDDALQQFTENPNGLQLSTRISLLKETLATRSSDALRGLILHYLKTSRDYS